MINHQVVLKDTGIAWLGSIPESWAIKKASWFFKAQKGANAAELTKDYCGLNQGPYPVYSGQTSDEGVMGRIDTFEFDFGDDGVLFSTTVGAKAMHVSHIKGKFSLSQNCMIIYSDSNLLDTRYFYYQFQSLFSYERGLIPDHMQASFRMEDLYQYRFALPSREEQTAISTYLDKETTRISQLIYEKQNFIDLLKEKRQALISHFVTKGLDDNVPMKDSGVEWIGEVPEHWELRPVKYLCKFMGGGTPSKDELSYWNGDIPWVSPKDMKRFWISDSIDKITEQAIQESSTNIVPEGSVLLVVRSGILQKVIPIGMTTRAVTLNQDMKALSFFRPELALFFAYFVQGGGVNLLLNWRKQGATVESLEHEYIARFPIPTPPVEEARLICAQLDKELTVFDALTSETESSIELLKEHRTALISAAVTGKIDVRGMVDTKGGAA